MEVQALNPKMLRQVLPTQAAFLVKKKISPPQTAAPSLTAAGLHHHVSMLFEDDIVAVVIEQDRNGAELLGGAAGFGNLIGLY